MNPLSFENFLNNFERLKNANEDLVTATIVHIVGAAPQVVGARIIVSKNGLEFGTVGGGKIEARCIAEATKMLSEQISQPFLAEWNLQKDIGMTCGGVVHIFFEIFRQKTAWTISVFGAGHICQELILLLTRLNCKVICTDPRKEWLDKLPTAENLKCIQTDDMQKIVDTLPDNSFIIISTMGHSFDLPILTKVMQQRHRFNYVGNIGSAQKALRLRNDLKTAGIADDVLKQFHCPMGEDFGDNTPYEIALSIVAQILKARDKK